MHHFVVKFSKIFFGSGGKGALTPLTKILLAFLAISDQSVSFLGQMPTSSSRAKFTFSYMAADRHIYSCCNTDRRTGWPSYNDGQMILDFAAAQ